MPHRVWCFVGLLGIDDKNGINACKLLSVAFTTEVGILVRMCEKRLLTKSEASRSRHGGGGPRSWR
jgi:hypothetical protein